MSELLRPYQLECVARAEEALQRGRSTLILLATGLGKTVIFSRLAQRHLEGGGRALVLENGEALVQQTADAIHDSTGLEVRIERAEDTCLGASPFPRLVVASVPSLCQPERLEAYAQQRFTLLIIDECHHALASSHRAILERFPNAKILGATATPDRLDQQALSQVFESVAFTYSLSDGIRGGWLAPVRQTRVLVQGLDFSSVRSAGADLNEADLERVFLEERHLHSVAAPILRHAGSRPTLVFAASVQHGRELATVMNRLRPESTQAVDGSAPRSKRRQVLEEFRTGRRQFLVNCSLYLEGFNEPSISCVAIARPTASRALYCQMVGRGTRLSKETGKRDLLVLDFVGNAGQHALVSALDVLGGVMAPRVRELAQQELDAGALLLQALERAEARDAVEAEGLRREEALQEAQRRGLNPVVRSILVEIATGFELYGVPPKVQPGDARRPLAAQVRALTGLGFTRRRIQMLGREQAEAVLKGDATRRAQRLSTREQVAYLANYAVDARQLKEWSARSIIQAIERNGWEPPVEEGATPPGPTADREVP